MLVGALIVSLLLLATGVRPGTAAAGTDGSATVLEADTDRAAATLKVGESFELHATVTNTSSRSTPPVAADFELVALAPGVKVDPEDWTTARTQRIAEIAPGESRTLTWRITAISPGRFASFVTFVPADGSSMAPVATPSIAIVAAGGKTLDPTGALPLSVGIPALLIGFGLIARTRRLP